MINLIKEIATILRDIGIIIGVPTLIIVFTKLYKQQISILNEKIKFLKETQYDNAKSLISSQEFCFMKERDILEKERDEVIKKLDDKSEFIAELNNKIEKLNNEIQALRTVKISLMNQAELETIRKLKLILKELHNPKEMIDEDIFISGTYGYNIWQTEFNIMLNNGWIKKIDSKIQITDKGIAIANDK